MNIQELIGERINLLTILNLGLKKHYVVAKCECGIVKEYYIYNILSHHTRSCGCLEDKLFKERSITHGMSKHPIYKLWVDIKKRCFNEKSEAYKNYGGRGIVMCDEWKNDFMIFYDWAINNGYVKGLEIDRENNDLGYCASNCRFVDRIVNANNTRKNKYITFNSETKTLSQWARAYNISPLVLYTRVKNNWDMLDALTIPVSKRGGNNRYIKKQPAA